MSDPFKITIKNLSGDKSHRTYHIFSQRPKILKAKNNSSVSDTTHNETTTVGIEDIYWPCCHVTNPIRNGSKESFEYAGQYFGFIGRHSKKGKHIELSDKVEVSLGDDSDDGTCLIARDDNGSLSIDRYPNSADHKATKGSFEIHCAAKSSGSNVVVGLARYFEPEDSDDPLPAAAVEYKHGRKYIITPNPAVCVTTNGSKKGDVTLAQSIPFEIAVPNPKLEAILTEDVHGQISSKYANEKLYDNPNSFDARTAPNDPSSERRKGQPNDSSSQNQRPKPGYQNQLPPGAKSRGLETHEQLFAYNFLSRFNKSMLKYYTDQDIIGIAKKTDVWFEQIRKVEGLDAEVLASLLLLSLYDCVLLLDDSQSMAWYQPKDGRKDQMRYVCKRLIDVDTIFANVDDTFTDTKGVQVEFINTVASKVVKTPAEFQAHFETIQFNGLTNLGGALCSKILKPRVYDVVNAGGRLKPLLISIITDGAPLPEPRDTLKNEVKRCVKLLRDKATLGDKTVVFQVSKVGSEKAAEEFISEIEDDLDLRNMVDCTSYTDLDPPPDYKPKIEKHAAVIKLLAGALLVNFEQYQDDDWKDIDIV